MDAALKVIGVEKCTGCFGCKNICPIPKAINMEIDNEGFYKANITDFCIECGICQKACPVISYEKINKLQNVYAAWSLDKETLSNSSSGGIFTELAKEVIKNNGVVYGAVWNNGKIEHIRINSIEEIKQLQGSKYIPSNIGLTYKEVLKDLKEERQVLYSGLPCQLAALQKIKNHSNLITVDLICHGVPSQKVFEKNYRELDKDTLEKTNFRDKEKGWINYNVSYFFKNKDKISHSRLEDIFFRGFMADLYLGTACYNCQFKGEKNGDSRIADITLADFWGVPEELLNNNLGVSLMTTNNLKGEKFINKIKNRIFIKKVDIDTALRGNKSFYASAKMNRNRNNFFKDIDKFTMIELEKKYFPKPHFIISFIRKQGSKVKKIIRKFFR